MVMARVAFEKLLNSIKKDFPDKDIIKYVDKKLKELDECWNQPGHDTNPNGFSYSQKKDEHAFQRAIYLECQSTLPVDNDNKPCRVYWADIELPVVFTKRGRRATVVDLVGLIETQKQGKETVKLTWEEPFLCELKYQNKISQAESPVIAIIELIFNYFNASNNKKLLDKHCVHRIGGRYFKWEKLSNLLIIAANETYWNKYKSLNSENIKGLIGKLFKELGVDIRLYSIGEITDKIPCQLKDPKQPWTQIKL